MNLMQRSVVGIKVDDRVVDIHVSPEIWAHYSEQFHRKTPGELQVRRFRTLKNLLRAAYFQGLRDAGRFD